MAIILDNPIVDTPSVIGSANGRTASFDRVGHAITAETEFVGALPADMAFTIRKERVGFCLPDGTFSPMNGVSTIVRNSDNYAFGPVSDKYPVVDNMTALGCLQYIDGLELKRYGSTKNGMQYLIGSLPDVTVLGDTFTPYLCFRNSFDGRFPIQACISPLRIVCQNQLTMAFREASNTFRIRHTLKASEYLEDAQEIMVGTADFMKELNTVAEQYAAKKITRAQETEIICEMFKVTDDMTPHAKQMMNDRKAQFVKAINEDDNANFKGTAWGLINAFSDVHTHPIIGRNTPTANENNFISISFDARPMMTMLSLVGNIAS